MILYLHGFLSSPESFKARILAEHMTSLGRKSEWRCPALPVAPAEAIRIAREAAAELLAEHDADPTQLTVIGSSLGGFYAIHLAETLGCRAVLLNPAVHAPRDLARHLGEQTHYHTGETIEFTQEDLQALQDLAVGQTTSPERYFLVAATGDEVLDWREMRDFLAHSPQKIIEGSDHGLSDFEQLLPEVMAFAYPDRTNQLG